jgi:hypothetical protein
MQHMEHDDMADERASPEGIKRDERKHPQDAHIEEEIAKQQVPPFLNEGPELIRDSHC